jgi:sec-independent protein translocase protein TatC
MSVVKDKSHSPQSTRVAEHLGELRNRFLVSALFLVLAGIGAYFIYEPILDILRSPLNQPLYYSTPAGSFAFVMQICLVAALAVTIPLLIYNNIMFVRPAFIQALPLSRVYLTTISSALLAFAGAAFGFLVIIPGALHFFSGFQVDGLSALITADSYMAFVTNVLITFVLVFQLPLIIIFIDTLKPLSPKKLLAFEKWVILGSLIVSFMVPFALDITTSLLISLPIIALYNLSIVIVLVRQAQRRRRQYRSVRTSKRNKKVQANSKYASEDWFSDEELARFARELNTTKPTHPSPSNEKVISDTAHTTEVPTVRISPRTAPQLKTVRRAPPAMSDVVRRRPATTTRTIVVKRG